MSWNTLTGQIYDLINDNKATLGIQEVSKYPKIKFTGYPSVTITPSDNENNYETTSENERIYAWKVRVFYETKDSGIDGALDALYPLVDAVMDKIDQENELSTGQTIGQGMPANYTYLNIFATPGAFFTVENENIIYSEFTVKIRVSVDVA